MRRHGGAPRLSWRTVIPWASVIFVAVSRWLAFPASIWDMDEANFALGVIDFDPVHNQPHAPFFPLWVALGKLTNWLVPTLGPSGALRLVSALASVAILWPLRSLWSRVLPRSQALAAAALYLFLPGVWLLSGRAYSEPTATALLVAAVAAWLPLRPARSGLAAGSVCLIAALLVRPQWLPVVLPFVVWRALRSPDARDRLVVLGIPLIVGGAAVVVVAHVSGGVGPLWAALEQHRVLTRFDQVHRAGHSLRRAEELQTECHGRQLRTIV